MSITESTQLLDLWWRELARLPHWKQAEILAYPQGSLALWLNALVVELAERIKH